MYALTLFLLSTSLRAETLQEKQIRTLEGLRGNSISIMDFGMYQLKKSFDTKIATDIVFGDAQKSNSYAFINVYQGWDDFGIRIVIRAVLAPSGIKPIILTKSYAEETCQQILTNLNVLTESKFVVKEIEDYFLNYYPVGNSLEYKEKYLGLTSDDIKSIIKLEGLVIYGDNGKGSYDCDSKLKF